MASTSSCGVVLLLAMAPLTAAFTPAGPLLSLGVRAKAFSPLASPTSAHIPLRLQGPACIAPGRTTTRSRGYGARGVAATLAAPITPTGVALLTLTIVLGVCGSTCIKLSDGFKNPVPTVGFFALYATTLSLFVVTLRHWPLSLAYAIWSGVGTAAVAVIGVKFFGEKLTRTNVFGMALVCCGVVAMYL
mmetsp:Transcript_56642/g.134565  ORF Transcript_56642/g.134565 Transcript_56642/m.134565 type:complete len:189 (+) Transcript_56642:44-610(+)